ncbi:TB2/DP1, HVA22 family-domain-containing protein, partial [Tribonema minus]
LLMTVTGKGGQCGLCDNITSLLLHLEDGSPDAIECSAICLWRFQRCIKTCERIKRALSESSHYPCVAAGMCPASDAYGEVNQCSYSWKQRSCLPEGPCYMKLRFPRPSCQLKPGFLEFNHYTQALRRNTGALARAVRELPRCGEPGAHATFCVNEPTGTGWAAMVVSYALVSVVGVWQSVRAVETPGGDDDRQWLAFWIIMFGFFTLERFVDVLLSWAPHYYEAKLAAVLYLMFGRGADLVYRRVHRAFVSAQRL